MVRNKIGGKPKSRTTFGEKKKHGGFALGMFSRLPPHKTIFNKPSIRRAELNKVGSGVGSISTGVQMDRTNTPITPGNQDPNKRVGGLSEFALAVSQQIKPKPQSF